MLWILPQLRLFRPSLPAKLAAESFIGDVGLNRYGYARYEELVHPPTDAMRIFAGAKRILHAPGNTHSGSLLRETRRQRSAEIDQRKRRPTIFRDRKSQPPLRKHPTPPHYHATKIITIPTPGQCEILLIVLLSLPRYQRGAGLSPARTASVHLPKQTGWATLYSTNCLIYCRSTRCGSQLPRQP